MFTPDLSSFTKVISKTARSQPEPLTFALTPELKARLETLGNGKRFGPVIVSRLGSPYEQKAWGRTWKRIREALDLPADLKLMDIRSGAITEARAMGADPFTLRDAAQHASITTTDRYIRGRSESAAKVVQLRSGQ